MPGMVSSRAPGIGAGGGRAAGRVHHPVAVAVDHQRRRGDRRAARGSGRRSGGSRRAGGPSPADDGSRSQRDAGQLADRTPRRTGSRASRCAGTCARRGRPPRSRVARRARPAISRQVDSAGRPDPARAGGRHDRGQRAYPVRGQCRDGLRDHAAHRDADEVGARRRRARRAARRCRRPGRRGRTAPAMPAPQQDRRPRRRPEAAGASTGRRRGCRTGSPGSRARASCVAERRSGQLCSCWPSPATSTSGVAAGVADLVVRRVMPAADVGESFSVTNALPVVDARARCGSCGRRAGGGARPRGRPWPARTRRRGSATARPARYVGTQVKSRSMRAQHDVHLHGARRRRRGTAGCRRRTGSSGTGRAWRRRTASGSNAPRVREDRRRRRGSGRCWRARSYPFGTVHRPSCEAVRLDLPAGEVDHRADPLHLDDRWPRAAPCRRRRPPRPASCSDVRVPAEPLDRPGERGRGRLVPGGEQGEQLVGDLAAATSAEPSS